MEQVIFVLMMIGAALIIYLVTSGPPAKEFPDMYHPECFMCTIPVCEEGCPYYKKEV